MSFNEWKVRRDLKGRAGGMGYSKKIRRRNRDPEAEEVIRVYVEKKLPLEELSSRELVPNEFDGIPTDVEEIGRPKAASMQDMVRPLVAGYSIGNMKITAGTLGYYFEEIAHPGPIYLGSNAHVFSDTLRPLALERRIVQPGVRDGGGPGDLVATLFKHTPLWRPLNPFNALYMILVNAAYQLAGMEPPYDLTDSTPRHVDFAVAKPSVDYERRVEGLANYDDFLGLYFATSDLRSWICKERYIREFGYRPVGVNVSSVDEGDLVYKGKSRTTQVTNSVHVLDDSMFLWVDYGGWYNNRPLDDIIMTELAIAGGDSGTAAWGSAVFE